MTNALDAIVELIEAAHSNRFASLTPLQQRTAVGMGKDTAVVSTLPLAKRIDQRFYLASDWRGIIDGLANGLDDMIGGELDDDDETRSVLEDLQTELVNAQSQLEAAGRVADWRVS